MFILNFDMKKYLYRTLSVVFFIFVVIVLLDRISIYKKSYSYEYQADRTAALFYEMPKNTVDVMFAGDSHVYCSFIPKQLFDETGISSASVATGRQNIINSYYLLKEALINQNIKVFVMDIHSIEDSIRETESLPHLTTGILALPDFSINKYENYLAIKNSKYGMYNEVFVDDVVGLLQFNDDFDRWYLDLKSSIEFMINPSSFYKTFGFYPTTNVVEVQELKDGVSKDVDLSLEESIIFKYLNDIKDLCVSNNISFIITKIPYFSNNVNRTVCHDIEKWAVDNDIHFLDYFKCFDEIGIDLNTDFRDETHLNILGARKITRYFGPYLKEIVDLEDHRGDSKYSLWEESDFDYAVFEEETIENSKKENNW